MVVMELRAHPVAASAMGEIWPWITAQSAATRPGKAVMVARVHLVRTASIPGKMAQKAVRVVMAVMVVMVGVSTIISGLHWLWITVVLKTTLLAQVAMGVLVPGEAMVLLLEMAVLVKAAMAAQAEMVATGVKAVVFTSPMV
jgi:hypothetical protein